MRSSLNSCIIHTLGYCCNLIKYLYIAPLQGSYSVALSALAYMMLSVVMNE